MTTNKTPDTGTPDPFARVLPFEPGDRVLLARCNGHDPIPGVVLGPTYRPRFHATLDPYVVNHTGSADNKLYDVRVIGGIGLDRDEHGYGIEAVRQSEMSLIVQDTGTPLAEVEALIERINEYYRHINYPHSPSPEYLQDLLDDIRTTIRTLASDNKRLTARIAELESKLVDERISAASEYGELETRANDRIAELEGQVATPMLARHQPCGCVICTCEGDRCHGCGAKSCGTHPIDETPNPVYEPTWQDQLAQAAKAEREWMLERLRQQAGRERENEHPKLADAIDYMIDVLEEEFAADHLEANGRDKTNG